MKERLEELLEVKEKAARLVLTVDRQGRLSPPVERSIQACQTLADLNLISAQFKTASKSSLAERARQAGLESAALNLLSGRQIHSHWSISVEILCSDWLTPERHSSRQICVFTRDQSGPV